MSEQHDLFTTLESEIRQALLNERTRTKLLDNLKQMRATELNILITGATGAGKSSTINALFDMGVAEVGISCEPHTQGVTQYRLNNLILWDSPGLGDGIEEDKRHARLLKNTLRARDEQNRFVIDLVLVILDGGSRDLGTPITLINNVLIPALGEDAQHRLIIAINQADNALKGNQSWDYETNTPTPASKAYLETMVRSVHRRVLLATGVYLKPVYYVAGHCDGLAKQRPYNLSKLLYLIVERLPKNKRLLLANRTLSPRHENWKDNDASDYNKKTSLSLWEAIFDTTTQGAQYGEEIGSVFGTTGKQLGKIIGGALGACLGSLRYLFGW
ncbi:GTPase family protein [Vibrio alginolyticus]|uniref:GTPase family protein n=1 Tax=Vibrio alginolyticus TaxID=663 RepID=UPI00215CCA05|nr:GTPase [Vibrio alginolyticus]MCR9353794.1 50S ribosome-binding GTPase [Vibrio alginolyticus]MCR9362233.1 50S ribosome-binding GTPase [Vibrio alginolyticus]